MSYTIQVEGSAQAELRHAIEWYEAHRPGLGVEFLDEIQRTIDILLHHPLLGGHVPFVSRALDVRRMLVRRFPFHVVYRLVGSNLQIIAFAHTSREPGYWL